MFLIDDILLAPLSGLLWVGEKLNEVVQHEVSDEGLIKEKLMGLQLRFEMDEVNEKEYNRQEAELLARLEAIRKAKEEEV
ncbi:MAG: gas vesicle protein GvpG [Elusimicrobia bacterium]|nr:gas vesicle protein GvpG [Elusimicrobiota bacterium]